MEIRFSSNHFLIYVLAFLVLLLSNPTGNCALLDYELKIGKTPNLIAHAGGTINGKRYLNTKEVVENSIKNDFKFIELDLLETSDHKIVAAHSWNELIELTHSSCSKFPCSSQEIKKRTIDGQTILMDKDIKSIFLLHPNLYLVTDKIENIDLIISNFNDFKNRIIMEVFSVNKYKEALKKGIQYPVFCVWDDENKYQLVDEYGIKMITLSSHQVEKRLSWFKKHPNLITLAFSVNGDQRANNSETIKKLYPYIKFWYTDFLRPNDIK